MTNKKNTVVLVVDDDPDLIAIMRFRLEEHGFDVLVASSGEEALKKLAEKPDVVLLDIQIPDMDGFEIAQYIPHSIPIIFVTGKVDFDRALLPKRENVSYTLKPPNFESLIAMINKRA